METLGWALLVAVIFVIFLAIIHALTKPEVKPLEKPRIVDIVEPKLSDPYPKSGETILYPKTPTNYAPAHRYAPVGPSSLQPSYKVPKHRVHIDDSIDPLTAVLMTEALRNAADDAFRDSSVAGSVRNEDRSSCEPSTVHNLTASHYDHSSNDWGSSSVPDSSSSCDSSSSSGC